MYMRFHIPVGILVEILNMFTVYSCYSRVHDKKIIRCHSTGTTNSISDVMIGNNSGLKERKQ